MGQAGCAGACHAADEVGEVRGEASLEPAPEASPAAKPLWLQEADAHSAKVGAEQEAAAAAKVDEAEKQAETAREGESATATNEPKGAEGKPAEDAAAAKASPGKVVTKKKVRPAAKDAQGSPQDATEPPAADTAAVVPAPKPKATSKAKAKSAQPQGNNEGDLFYALKVHIVSARNLRNADIIGQSDPFCVCEIKGKSASRFQTKVVEETDTPRWDHVVELTGFAPSDTLHFDVWDKDTLSKSDLLGTVEISKDQFMPSSLDGEVKLFDKGAKSGAKDAMLKLKVEVLRSYLDDASKAKVQVKPCVAGDAAGVQPSVFLTIMEAKGLRNADWAVNGKSDPYVICEIPGKDKSRIKTPVVKDNCDPVWNHRGQLVGYEVGDTASIAVFDQDVGMKTDDLLGRVTLTREHLSKGSVVDLPLKDAGKGIKATLKIKVEVKPGAAVAK